MKIVREKDATKNKGKIIKNIFCFKKAKHFFELAQLLLTKITRRVKQSRKWTIETV